MLAVEGSVLMDELAIALLLAGGLDRTARAPSTRCATGGAVGGVAGGAAGEEDNGTGGRESRRGGSEK